MEQLRACNKEVLAAYDVLQEVSGLVVVLILGSMILLIRYSTKRRVEEKPRGAKGTSSE